MLKIEVENRVYEIIEENKNAFDKEEFINCYTDYFYDYDYIVGDIAYGKLRLKGFYDAKNKRVKSFNNYNNVKKYIQEDCAVECGYYILKKVDGKN